MAYDQSKEEVFKSEKLSLEDGSFAEGKVYSYNNGDKRFKLLFSTENGKFFTSKFKGITTKKDLQRIIKVLKACESELM